MTRIGLPRALSFLQHYPQWRTFFEGLGAEVVFSPPTNREIMSAGARVVADLTCLPVKVYAGHVIWLRDNGHVDFVFMPAIWNIEPGAFHCAKFKAIPDIMRACVPNCPPILDIEVNPQWRKRFAIDAFRKLGQRFTRSTRKIDQAWQHANAIDADYGNLLVSEQLTYPEALARLYPNEWAAPARPLDERNDLTIAVVGHPYCLYDDYVNHNLIAHLRDLGARVVTSEMVGLDDARRGIERTTHQVRWFYENWMSGAAGYYLYRSDVDGLIAALAFACAPDSTMVETVKRRAHALNRSAMSLVLDEHGSATGMMTRLEAFVDMIRRQKRRAPAESSGPIHHPVSGRVAPNAAPAVLKASKRPVLGFPRMGTTFIPLKSLFRGIGAQLEFGPPLSKKTVAIGEIGLDYYRMFSPKEDQIRAFKAQIELAFKLNLPIVYHVREAFDDTWKIILETKAYQLGGIMHSFSGTIEQAKKVTDMGLHISFNGSLTYKNSLAQKVLPSVPEELILVETDCPYLTPELYRGKRNQPDYVRHVINKMAETLQKSSPEVEQLTTRNALQAYRLKD